MAGSRNGRDPNLQNGTITIKPDLDSIRGNDTSGIAELSLFPRSLPSRSQAIREDDYALYMREYIAQNFGRNGVTQNLPLEVQGRSDQVDVLGLGLNTQSKPEQPAELDLDGQSDDERQDTLRETLRDIDLTLQNSHTQESTISEPEQPLPVPPTSSKVKVDVAPSFDSTREPRSSEMHSDKSFKLSDVRNRLTPRRGCDESFFPSCSATFISDWEVWSYLTEDLVCQILDDSEPANSTSEREDIAELAKTICGMPSSETDTDFISYRKIFAILILMKMHSKIREFISKETHDGLLPLGHEGSHKDPSAILVPGRHARHPCFKDWDTADIQDFLKRQMQFCAPFFKQGEKPGHYLFPTKVALPFLSLPNSRPGHDVGGYGIITKVEIPRSNGDLRTYHRGGQRVFAIKRLLYPDREDFLNEADSLGRLNNASSKHLAILSATFEIGTKTSPPTFYFIFPRADSNLNAFWMAHNEDDRPAKFSRWMARQFTGLAEALQIVHDLNRGRLPADKTSRSRGIHGDIKPENILFFSDWEGCDDNIGTLQLADFGLTRYHHSETVSKVVFQAGLGPYDPPEKDLLRKSGQALDVWALGCLFVEFGIWLMFGVDGLKGFKDARRSTHFWIEHFQPITFFEMERIYGCWDESKVEIRIGDGVVEWITKAHKHETCTAFMHDIFEFIVEKMFVLDPTDKHMHSKMGLLRRLRDSQLYEQVIARWTKSPVGRAKIGEVVQFLAAINENEKAYFERPAAYTRREVWFPKPIYTHTTVFQAQDLANALRREEETPTPSQLYDEPDTMSVVSEDRATLLDN